MQSVGDLPELDEIEVSIMEKLQKAMDDMTALMALLEKVGGVG